MSKFVEATGLEILEAGDADDALAIIGDPTQHITVLVTDLDLGLGDDGLVLSGTGPPTSSRLYRLFMLPAAQKLTGHSVAAWEKVFYKPFNPNSLVTTVLALNDTRAARTGSPSLSGMAVSPMRSASSIFRFDGPLRPGIERRRWDGIGIVGHFNLCWVRQVISAYRAEFLGPTGAHPWSGTRAPQPSRRGLEQCHVTALPLMLGQQLGRLEHRQPEDLRNRGQKLVSASNGRCGPAGPGDRPWASSSPNSSPRCQAWCGRHQDGTGAVPAAVEQDCCGGLTPAPSPATNRLHTGRCRLKLIRALYTLVSTIRL